MQTEILPDEGLAEAIRRSEGPPDRLPGSGETMPGSTTRTWRVVDGTAVLVHVHVPSEGSARGAVVLLAPPGHEGLINHRFLVALAARLVRLGLAVVRPEWSGVTGSGTPEQGSPPMPTRWGAEVADALALAAELVPAAPVSLVACGVAGAVAATALHERAARVSSLVLVAPVGKGRTYVRSRAALLGVAVRAQGLPTPDLLDPSGTAALPGVELGVDDVADWARVDLAHAWSPGLAEDVVVVSGPDVPLDRSARAFVAASGALTVEVAGLGVQVDRPGMFTVARLDLADAVARHLADRGGPERGVLPVRSAATAVVLRAGRVAVEDELVEVAGMPGVVTHAVGRPRRVLVWATTAAEPHSGVGGMWAVLARELARRGVTTVRYDMRGLGEQVLVDEPRDPDPHDLRAVDQQVAAVGWARDRFGTLPDVGGTCSGSFLALTAAGRVPCRSVISVSHSAWTTDPDLVAPDTLRGDAVTVVPDPLGPEGTRGGSRLGRLGALARERGRGRAPYALRRVLAEQGRVQGIEPPVRAAAVLGASVHCLMGDLDAHLFRERGGGAAIRRLRRQGVDLTLEQDHLLDHSVLTPYARARLNAFVIGRLVD